MFRNIALILSLTLFISCQSKQPKPEDGNVPAPTQDAETSPVEKVTDTPMNFDTSGSDSGKIEGLKTVHFDYDASKITAAARKTLASNAEWIKKNKGVTVQIEGHCDDRGSIEYNLALGERRAKSVKNYMISLGIDAKRLTVISFGKEKPIASGDSEDAYAKNRRANFVPMGQ